MPCPAKRSRALAAEMLQVVTAPGAIREGPCPFALGGLGVACTLLEVPNVFFPVPQNKVVSFSFFPVEH